MTPDVEDITQAALSLLQAELPGTLATIDAGKAQPLQPDAPQTWVFGAMQNLAAMPAVLVVGTETKTVRDAIDWREQTVNLGVEVYYQGADVEAVNRILRRYGAAIDAVLRAHNTLEREHVQNVGAITQNYAGLAKTEDGTLFQSLLVTADITVMTD